MKKTLLVAAAAGLSVAALALTQTFVWAQEAAAPKYTIKEVMEQAHKGGLLQKVADGDAKLTDPEYVAAAQAVADLGTAGYFGQGVGSIDYDTAFNTFLTGKAAFFYMGSWALANFADEKANQIGSDNIGFLPFPNVTGGKGDASQTPATSPE